jgi:IS30 family transposase
LPILHRISIDQRPPEVDGKRFGDWEMDTIVGPNNKEAIVNMNKLIRPATELLSLTEQSMFMEKIAVYQLQTSDAFGIGYMEWCFIYLQTCDPYGVMSEDL